MPKSFEPLFGKDPKILILGSMPGAESLRLGQYYAHPQNRFFKILFRYFDTPYSEDYETRKALIGRNGLALWDTVKSCARENSSLDSKIKDAVPNDIAGFLASHRTVRAVFTNGRYSHDIFLKYFPDLADASAFRAMPSTSPANAGIKTEELFGIWKAALDEFLK